MKTDQKWVHVIGVCGKTTSGTALMYKSKGYKVSGSDKGFFPPISTFLEKNGFQILPGFKKERLTDENGKHPDLVVAFGLLGEQNSELEEATRLNIPTFSYAEILEQEVVFEGGSIVVTGTYGKSTITSALVKIFKQANQDISYMIGALTRDFMPTIVAKTESTKYSIIEGDEYMVSLQEQRSKFFRYHPNYILITAVQWDHTDMFKTEKDYIENFKQLVMTVPEDGLIVANANDANAVAVCSSAKCKVVYYSRNKMGAVVSPQWTLDSTSQPLPSFVRDSADSTLEIIPFERNVLGDYHDENFLAAAALSSELGIRKERIQEAIEEFPGMKGRLELVFESSTKNVIDDFASSPPKVKGTLSTLRSEYAAAHIVAVFEPNTGNRVAQSLPLYDDVFAQADHIILPRFTKLPKTELDRFDGAFLYQYLKEKHNNVEYIPTDEELIRKLIELQSDKHIVIAFLGSHGFRGMIEELVSRLEAN